MKINGIKKLAGESKHLAHANYVIEFAYNMAEQKVVWEEHASKNSYVRWADGVVPVGYLTQPATMQEIKEMVRVAVARYTAIINQQ